MNTRRLEEQLVLHEGLKEHAYLDTEGNWTIGVGYNLSARGVDALEDVCRRTLGPDPEDVRITAAEARRMLRVDIARVERAVQVHFPEYAALDEVRQRVVMDMAFNMGFTALTFRNAIDAIKRRDWSRAAKEMYRSKWARQVGDGEGGRFDRADRLAKMMLTGQDYTE